MTVDSYRLCRLHLYLDYDFEEGTLRCSLGNDLLGPLSSLTWPSCTRGKAGVRPTEWFCTPLPVTSSGPGSCGFAATSSVVGAWPPWLLDSFFLNYPFLAFGANRQVLEPWNLLFLHPWGPWRKELFVSQAVRSDWDPDLPSLSPFAHFPRNTARCVVGLLYGADGRYWGQSDSDSSWGMISVCFVKSPLLILLPTPLKQMCIQNKTHEAYQKESDGQLPRGRKTSACLCLFTQLQAWSLIFRRVPSG